jgi:putative protease
MLINIEILSPAGSPESLHAALNTGADAIYLGLPDFSARMNAKNFTHDEFQEAARLCRLSGVKLYLALNTLIYDDEIPTLKNTLEFAVKSGIDAVIIQDLGVLAVVKEIAPNVKLHASTQMTITSVSGAEAAKKLGFSRVVLARELTLEEITGITRSVDIETEVFIHGALCSSVSGQCYISAFFSGGKSAPSRSGNRGQCAQPCRLNFTAGDKENALSLKDLSIIDKISSLNEIGVTAVKIEGRMKRPEYVAAVTDACFKARSGLPYSTRNLEAVFSRNGFTDGYFTGETQNMHGFRNKENVLASENVLKELQNLYKEPFKRRKININIKVSEKITCEAVCGDLNITLDFPPAEKAQNRSTTANEIITQLSKFGGTIFEAGEISCEIDDGVFISAAGINAIRREIMNRIKESYENFSG